jgi:hypothetical protein|tara:strand:- start:6312 stop:7151 length:840 start_codon:yes stop_codon:yes gene_type:complete
MAKLKVSNSVGQFRLKAQKAWGLKEWEGIDDPDDELIFFGLFHDRDFEVFHNFKGKKSVFWCGGDILRLVEDYERQRVMKIAPNTKHYCENEEEAKNLRKAGIDPIVIPSFLGEIEDYPVSFKPPEEGEKWKIWMCGHPRREVEYGFDKAKELAKMFPDVEFHFYGVDKEYEGKANLGSDSLPNVIYHGLVPEERLDLEIKDYHAGMRCNEHDGMSEVVVKSVLLGQYTISRMPYEGVWHFKTLEDLVELIKKLKQQKQPNSISELWKQKLNCFPWVVK